MSLDTNAYKDALSIVEVGDTYLVDASHHNESFYKEKFNSELIPAAITNLDTKDQNSRYPLFFVDNDELSSVAVTINPEILANNLYPDDIAVVTKNNKEIRLPINYHNFDSNFEVAINYHYLDNAGEDIITHYGVKVTKENKKNVCRYFSYNNYSDSIIDYQGKLSELIRNQERNNFTHLAQLSCLVSITFCFIFIVLLFNYINKNINDLDLLSLHGFSRKSLTMLVMFVPITSFLFASIIQFGFCYLVSFCYNNFKLAATPSINYGLNSLKLFFISTTLILLFQILGFIYFAILKKRGRIDA